jgi:polyhydroxyalkanoate synthesis regulator phasin
LTGSWAAGRILARTRVGGGGVASGREQYIQALASLSDLTRAQAERVAALPAKQGEVQSAQVGRVAEDLMRRTQKNREIMTRLVQREVKRQLGVLGMATRDEVARLQQRVRALEQAVERASQAPAPGPKPAASAKPAARSKPATAKAATTSRAKTASAGSGAAKPSTRTRTGGSSSRSTASSPSTRRKKDSGGSG